jgi:septal ring factor EnvC (AmiA/AmiB activator)
VSDTPIPPPPDTQPPEQEDFDSSRALKTIMFQVAAIYAELPSWKRTLEGVTDQQKEHERRIKCLEAEAMTLDASIKALNVRVQTIEAQIAELKAA